MEPQELLDTREGPALEQWGQRQIATCKPTLIRVVQKSHRLPTPPENSWLGRVDAKTKPYETSQQVRVFAQVAADNLREVDAVLRGGLPMFALYSLIRSAMEASSLALWILDAKSEDLAASRTLRVYRQNIESDRTLWKTVVGRHSGDHQALASTAEANHRSLRGIDHSSFEDAVQSTSVIELTDRMHPSGTNGMDVLSGLEVWRICSAVTHANQVSLLNIMERHPEGPRGASVTRTSRMSFVASLYSTALDRTNLLIDAFQNRSRPRRTGR
ncbi:hypothetical protein [Microbacterium sp. UCD-TDU]|uniref:hypothetical protein n=1 Tax=Microbacterium sp. UCD-TDU TaxID=1247714 RepID=UPI00036BAEF3|nr:hypothetical protein [Microbacterium sp. UCD-TDU]EYT60879.1 hypothetical protein D514_0104200 [Microbacterium sp. UCD-TDU]